MPFYPGVVANDLDDYTDEIRAYARDDEGAVEKYEEALSDALSEYGSESLHEELDPDTSPGALPTTEWDTHEGPIVPFETSTSWENHEDVNRFARGVLKGMTTVAADGSELGPTDKFTVPLGLVQVAWTANHHETEGNYDGDVHIRLLGPDTVTKPSDKRDGFRYTDEQVPSHERYRDEGEMIVECIRNVADRDSLSVAIYDGPLVPSFAITYGADVSSDYRETMARVLAASKHHEVPVVGYTAGTKRKNIVEMLRGAYPELLTDEPYVADARLLDGFTENWGDRSLAFVNRWDSTVDELTTIYEGTEYGYEDEVLFTYLDVPGGAMDYLEFPEWIQRDGMVEDVIDVVRAETGVGRGYPEILQQADANAVLDAGAKRKFLSLVQEFADAEGLPIEWDVKALSKQRRRR